MKVSFKKCSAAILSAMMLVSGLQTYQRTIGTNAAGKLLAFPGAVGGGKYATGGRGGDVYHVTNLNDSGAGSFRDAVSKPNRIVVFDVSGTIELQSNIVCTDNITIAGQTAPGGSGVTLKNYKFGMGGDNIIVRYISSRPGPDKCTSSGNDGWGGAKGSHSIVDHCSLGWTTDEQWGLYSNNEYYTVQYSVIGPANSWGGHVKGVHGFGVMMGKGYLSFDHNLIIHNVSRNFRGKVVGTETADFTNNIIYDWGYQTAYGTIGHLNYVNNTLKAGNSTTGGYHWMYVDSGTSPHNFKVYCAGNRLINKDGSFHAVTNDNWSGVTVKESIGITKNDLYSASPFATELNGENVSTALTCESAADSYDHVISFAGNGISPTKRTKIDQQCADETKNGTGQCSGTEAYDSSQSGLSKYNIKCGVTYEYPAAVTKKEITDTDNDGMADDWELARGLNPNNPADYKGDYCGQGYMNIEYYINDLTVDSFPAGVVVLSPTNGTSSPTEPAEPTEPETRPSINGRIIKDLQILDESYFSGWQLADGVKDGALIYGDRDATFTGLPESLSGAEQLITACDSKNTDANLATFTVGQDADIYIGLDNRVTAAPAWLSDYTRTNLAFGNSNGVTYVVYKKSLNSGDTVTVGTNGQSSGCVNYTVFVIGTDNSLSVRGDINANGEFSVADLVVLQKWLLGVPDTQLPDWKAGDLCEDGRLDTFDLCLMRSELLT